MCVALIPGAFPPDPEPDLGPTPPSESTGACGCAECQPSRYSWCRGCKQPVVTTKAKAREGSNDRSRSRSSDSNTSSSKKKKNGTVESQSDWVYSNVADGMHHHRHHRHQRIGDTDHHFSHSYTHPTDGTTKHNRPTTEASSFISNRATPSASHFYQHRSTIKDDRRETFTCYRSWSSSSPNIPAAKDNRKRPIVYVAIED